MNCFRCNSNEHIVKDCPVPDRRICKFCSEIGHGLHRCPKLENVMKKSKTNSISLIQNLNDIYKKEVYIGGKLFNGYLDTGAQLNVVSLQVVNELGCSVRETDASLSGFTGHAVPAMGLVSLVMSVDGLDFDTTAVVTHLKLPADVDVLIGQPIINSQGVSFVTTKNSAMLKVNSIERLDEKFKVTVDSDVELQPQASAFVAVNIIANASGNNVCTTPRFHDLHNKNFVVPATLLSGKSGLIRLYNMGQNQLSLKKGDLITRAVSCEVMENNTLETNGSKDDDLVLQTKKVKVRNCFKIFNLSVALSLLN